MRQKKSVKLCVLISVSILMVGIQSRCQENANSKEIVRFQSGQFNIVGDLKFPDGAGPFPLVIFVHGDGPAYRSYFWKIQECILNAGYAVLIWDKPGSGESKGKLEPKYLQVERSGILLDAIEHVKSHRAIDGSRIGVWGISQAGYVIPRALKKTNHIRFLILTGCAGENGIQQTAYQIKRQLVFEGLSEEEAQKMETHFIRLYDAENFESYIRHARPLYDNPIQRKLGYVSALWDQTNWKPHDPNEEAYYNPIPAYKNVSIPMLVFFGEKDTQVDPVQGEKAYRQVFQKEGKRNFRIEIIPGADHDIILCQTGSMKERSKRSRKGWSNYSPEYLEIMGAWLKTLLN